MAQVELVCGEISTILNTSGVSIYSKLNVQDRYDGVTVDPEIYLDFTTDSDIESLSEEKKVLWKSKELGILQEVMIESITPNFSGNVYRVLIKI